VNWRPPATEGRGFRYSRDVKTLSIAILLTLAAALAADMPVIQPKDLAAHLSEKPVVLHVGFNVLYRNSKHIPGAVYAGPGRQPEGLDMLKAAVEKLPRDREIVIYCGCCPWDHCPNIRPAIALLQQLGFKNVKALYLAENYKVNWIDAGYPVE
jgi:thiosulfate/3-mercaptopyruvate sulfurtransferase